ncbi:MAG TPA: hypothetical protein DCE41_01830 [Cytophagales bacterium]|nr:hypothetical protein [Cytophagales bacterium]HAA19893.1 hypothetical protein [Cytophagales bacterium]HAP62680.1 hypothetical protein [Cytophagales bacterium]
MIEQSGLGLIVEAWVSGTITHPQALLWGLVVLSLGFGIAMWAKNRQTLRRYRTMEALLKTKQREVLGKNRQLGIALKDLEKRQHTIDERNKKLIEMNRLKTKMFSVISHDLRSPLATVIGLLDLLREGHISASETKVFAEKATMRVQSTFEMLTNLLYWSRKQMRGVEVKTQEINLDQLITEVLRVYQPIGQSKGVQVTKDTYGPVNVVGDPDMINLILRNLISNAIKFTPRGGQVTVSQTDMDEYVSIAISDTGVGMDEKTTRKLFSNQVQSSLGTNQEKGTGLGLNLVREFVHLNQGKLTVESTPGTGSTFRFTLLALENTLQKAV